MRFNRFALKAWRTERGVRTSDMATALGITPGYYCDLESGRKPGTTALVKAAANHLKVPVLVLIANPNESAADVDQLTA